MDRRLAFALAALALVAALPPPAQATHAGPIVVVGDAAFTSAHWTGSGTAGDPYRLAVAPPTPDGFALELVNTRKHVNLSGLTIAGGGARSDGIHLTNATNVTIYGSTFASNRIGVHVLRSSGIVIVGNEIKTSSAGVYLEDSRGVTIRENRIALNDKDVWFKLASKNALRENNLSIATGQVGLFLEDNVSFDNAVEATNVVNGVPVRWYAGAADLTLSNVTVDLAGITNVAQVLVHNSTTVTLDRPVAKSGVGSGILVHRSTGIKLLEAVAENNARSGVALELSNASRVVNLSARNNGASGLSISSGRDTTLEGADLEDNARDGVRANNATDVLTLGGLRVARNAQLGVHADTARNVTIERAHFDGDGLVLLAARGVVVRNSTLDRAGIVLNATANALLEDVSIVRPPRDGVFDFGSSDLRVSRVRVEGASVHGINATKTMRFLLNGSVVLDARATGVRAAEIAALDLRQNVVDGAQIGISLEGVPPAARVSENSIANASSGFRVARTESAQFASNVVSMEPERFGFRFDDEASYNNAIPGSNVVNGAPMQWFVGLVGTPSQPITLPGVRSELRGITNVAQVMLYRSAEVALPDLVATNGTARGLYLYRSSAVNVTGANTSGNALAGVELNLTRSSAIRDLTARSSGVGIRLADALGNSISNVDASGATTGVRLTRGSRDNVVDRVEVNGTARGILDEGWNSSTLQGSNSLVDAGVARRVRVGVPLDLRDMVATYRHDSDRIVEQRWRWDDGTPDDVSVAQEIFRPVHAYAEPGSYRAEIVVSMLNGAILRDSAVVEVVAPLSVPRNFTLAVENGTATLRWQEPTSDGGSAITEYRVYRGANETNLTLVDSTESFEIVNAGLDEGAAYVYAVAAVNADGEGPRATVSLVPEPPTNVTPSAEANATPTPNRTRIPRATPSPREDPADTPLPLLLVVTALLVASVLPRRRR